MMFNAHMYSTDVMEGHSHFRNLHRHAIAWICLRSRGYVPSPIHVS